MTRPGGASRPIRTASTAWLARDALEVAPELLGAHLRVLGPEGAVVVRLTEVEAYRGTEDPGSHAFRGRTRRNAVMFGPAGHVYVYFTYGMHWCANVVCGTEGWASAVLLRAGEVVEGLPLARARRPAARIDADLARGPARLCQALGVTGADDGAALALVADVADGGSARVSLSPPSSPVAFAQGPRVGVVGAGGDPAVYPWRFWVPGERTVSAFRPGRPRRVAAPGRVRGTAD